MILQKPSSNDAYNDGSRYNHHRNHNFMMFWEKLSWFVHHLRSCEPFLWLSHPHALSHSPLHVVPSLGSCSPSLTDCHRFLLCHPAPSSNISTMSRGLCRGMSCEGLCRSLIFTSNFLASWYVHWRWMLL